MHAMTRAGNTTIRILKHVNQIQEDLWLPAEVITHIAGYCWPKEKNILMRLSQPFREGLKNRTKVLCANPLTISMFDKIESLIDYARTGNTEMIEFLIRNGVKAQCKNILQITPFHVASENKQMHAMQLLVDHGADVNELKPQVHPLHEAVYKGDTKAIQALLALKVNPNVTMAKDVTALFIASLKGHAEIVKLLLAGGATANCLTKIKGTCLQAASMTGHREITELLLAAGADVNQAKNDEMNPLILASRCAHIDIVKLLIAAGAEVDYKNDQGYTSLILASTCGYTDIVKVLLAAVANVDHVSNNKITPLYMASQNGHTDSVRLLIAAGANVNHVNNSGVALLEIASQYGHADIVKLLLAAGADINHMDKNGNTALCVASHKGYTEIVRLLLPAHVNINKGMNADYVKAFRIAQQHGHTQIVELFHSQERRIETENRLQKKEDPTEEYLKDPQEDLKYFIDRLPNTLNKK